MNLIEREKDVLLDRIKIRFWVLIFKMLELVYYR